MHGCLMRTVGGHVMIVLRVVPSGRPRMALGWCQILLAAGICWAAFMINHVLPFLPEPRALSGWDVAMTNLTRSLMALLPATLLWGASFPLAMAAAKRNGDDPARPVARVYAANTFGGIVGALVARLTGAKSLSGSQDKRSYKNGASQNVGPETTSV